MSRSTDSLSTTHRRITLLAGQAFSLGVSMAWILIPANSIFLDRYGSQLLPVTYIGAALAGAATSASLAAALRRRPLVDVTVRLLVGQSLLLLASWLLLWRAGASWVSFGLLVLVPIVVPVGFMVILGQAGMLLDVRMMKVLYARVVAGFALGFFVGGLVAPVVLDALGRAAHLVAAAAVVTAVFGALVAITRRCFTAQLSVVEHDGADDHRPGSGALLRNPFVRTIIAFQMLSAIESQWLDYLVFDRAAHRYHGTDELARFISRFTAISFGSDIVLLLLAAGYMLRRFGLRYGLTANAGGVLALLAAVLVAASVYGSGATTVFVLIVAARVVDLVLSDCTSRTSLGAAYQAVPGPLRLLAQAKVEGLAVPVAIGLSGVVLLVLRATGGTSGKTLPLLTAAIVVVWFVVAVAVYRGYRSNLLTNLRHRVLDPAELDIDSASISIVIDRLVASHDERDVRLGLDTLTAAGHPLLISHLASLASDDRVNVRCDALEQLAALDAEAAAVEARRSLDHPSVEVRKVALNAMAAARNPADLELIRSHWIDEKSTVKVAAAAAMACLGDDQTRAQISDEIARLSKGTPGERILAAQMLGACEPGPWLNREALRSLHEDSHHEVVIAALAATRWPDDATLLPRVVASLGDRRTVHAAAGALVRAGEPVLAVVDECLLGQRLDARSQASLVRVCRLIGGAGAVAVLSKHAERADRDVGLVILGALAALGSEPISLAADLEHATRVLRALVVLEHNDAAVTLCSALRDELELVRRRVLA
ncbi:MAG TPA: hypothetical protein VH761_16985, partial [Ilumatobacteraceae bacterium]